METVKIRCKDLMVGDYIANRNGSPMQIVAVDEDNAYACEGNEERPWIFGDNEGYEPRPIPITPEILEKNGWKWYGYFNPSYAMYDFCAMDENGYHLEWKRGTLSISYDYNKDNNDTYFDDNLIPTKYVHRLQQILRIVGLNDMADNFKI